MQFSQINLDDPESMKIIVKNVDGSGTITTGYGACFVNTGTSTNCINAVKSTSGNLKTFAGVAVQDIPINGYGLVTAWGYARSVAISNVGSSVTINSGDILAIGAMAGTFTSTNSTPYVSIVSMSPSFNISTAVNAYCSGWVKVL